MSDIAETVTLWRPVGPEELALMRAADMRAFPPRLPEPMDCAVAGLSNGAAGQRAGAGGAVG